LLLLRVALPIPRARPFGVLIEGMQVQKKHMNVYVK